MSRGFSCRTYRFNSCWDSALLIHAAFWRSGSHHHSGRPATSAFAALVIMVAAASQLLGAGLAPCKGHAQAPARFSGLRRLASSKMIETRAFKLNALSAAPRR